MPSVTIPTSTGPRWGDSSFNSSTASLKVGKSGTSTYYGYVGFPALNPTWAVKSITFKMNRTDSYSTHVLQFGSSIVLNTFDQNRVFTGVKQGLGRSWSFDLGYMLVYQQKASGYQYDLNHTLRWFFYFTPDVRGHRPRHEPSGADE